ncbi:hypothetical protein WJX74_008399 [Apatococcus lobatus]|uniref:acetylglutamate kinase n=1 Tax=Apatococcus lobatus TaxID=904363 RepID=A0AAW1RIL8_9CHLO
MYCQRLPWLESPAVARLVHAQHASAGRFQERSSLTAQPPAHSSRGSSSARLSLAASVQQLHELDDLRQALSRPPKTQHTLRDPARLAAQSQHSIEVQDLGGDVSLDAYMHLPVEQYSELDPDVIKSIGLQLFALKVPRVHLFQIWIEPLVQATVNVQQDPDRVIIESTNCRIRGSELVENLHLDDRFCIAFTTQLQWSSSGLGTSPGHASSTSADNNGSSSSFMMQNNSAVQQQAADAHRIAIQQTSQTSTIHLVGQSRDRLPAALTTSCKRTRKQHSQAKLSVSNAATTEAPGKVPDTKREVSAFDRVSILSEALPYLQRFQGKTVVIKYGGAAMKDPTLKAGVVNDLVLLSCVGVRTVLVHGGGPEINTWLNKLGIEAQFKNGLRVTDEPTMDVVEMVLGGRVNKGLVTLIQQAGGRAVGLCGKDNSIIKARQMVEKDIGFVGEVTKVDPSLLETLVRDGFTPVVASVAADEHGQALNVNADIAAGEIAAALKAEKLILMTDVPGVLRDKDDISTKFHEMDIRQTRELVADGIIAGGMIPKVECCVRCLAQGVSAAHIIDGRQQHSVLMELLTNEGVGTMIVG